MTRSRDFFISLWWERHPLIADRQMTLADAVKLRPERDRLARELLAAHDALIAADQEGDRG